MTERTAPTAQSLAVAQQQGAGSYLHSRRGWDVYERAIIHESGKLYLGNDRTIVGTGAEITGSLHGQATSPGHAWLGANAATSNPLEPPARLLAKLGSLVVHLDEYTSPGAHPVDMRAAHSLLVDPEVQAWLQAMQKLALVPVKRG